MTAMPKFKAEVTTTDIARVGDRVARVFAAMDLRHTRAGQRDDAHHVRGWLYPDR